MPEETGAKLSSDRRCSLSAEAMPVPEQQMRVQTRSNGAVGPQRRGSVQVQSVIAPRGRGTLVWPPSRNRGMLSPRGWEPSRGTTMAQARPQSVVESYDTWCASYALSGLLCQ